MRPSGCGASTRTSSSPLRCPRRCEALPSDTLRLVTANAACGRDAVGHHDHAAWARAAAALDPDVLGVQEVDHLLPRSGGADQTAVLAAAVGAVDVRFLPAVAGSPGTRDVRPTTDDDRGPSYGVALLSRHPVEAWHTRRMAPSRAWLPIPLPPGVPGRVLWVPDEPRVGLAAVVRTPAGRLTAVTTHLSFSPPRAAAQLRELVAWTRALPGPVVLLGDLNLPGRLPAWLSGWLRGGSADAAHPTYPAGRPRVQLDHVLLAPGPGRPRVTGAAAHRVGESDHLALAVDVALGSAS